MEKINWKELEIYFGDLDADGNSYTVDYRTPGGLEIFRGFQKTNSLDSSTDLGALYFRDPADFDEDGMARDGSNDHICDEVYSNTDVDWRGFTAYFRAHRDD